MRMINVGKKGRLAGGVIAGGRPRNAGVAAGLEDNLEIRLPDFHVLRLVARSLLALFLISLPVLGIGPHPGPITAAVAAAPGHAIDDTFFLPMLLRDLRRQGLLRPGGRAVLLGQSAVAGGRLSRVLKQNKMKLVAGHGGSSDGGRPSVVPDGTLDFVFFDGGFPDAVSVDRALKVGGVAVVRLGPNQAGVHRMGPNYKIVYVRRFGSTVVAMRKLAEKKMKKKKKEAENAATGAGPRRRLLAGPETTKEVLSELEDVLLEPPRLRRMPPPARYLKRAKYLPDLMGDALENYPRRVFVEVVSGSKRKAGAAEWFARNYPTRNRAFEIIKVEVERGGLGAGAERSEEMSGWLRRNVRAEEYVVMKAEAGVVEEMVGSGAAALVDELFLECGGRAGGRRRAYWECLALYGKLRDAGVAVHQWWWG